MGPKKAPVVVDGVDTTTMSREQLEQFALRLKEELDREREERNYFQMERDKIRTFWEITRQQLDDTRSELRNKERDMGLEESRHRNEEKIFKQKSKNYLFEQQMEIAEMRKQQMITLQMTQSDFKEREEAILADKQNLKEKLMEQTKEHQEELNALNMKFSEDMSTARDEFQTEAREIETKYLHKLDVLRTDLGLRHTMEMTEVDERKNKHIADLMKQHDEAFTEMKNYYNDITLNNLALISCMKEEVEEMKRKEEQKDKILRETERENKKLQEPVRRAMIEMGELKRKLANYEKDKASLVFTKKQLEATKKDLLDMELESNVMQMRLEHTEKEKDEYKDKFVSAILEVQEHAALRTVLLQKKLKAFIHLLEERELQYGEVMAQLKADPKILAVFKKRVDAVLRKKNAAIEDLEYELARVCKAHEDLLQTYEGKLVKYGIPKEELGFLPLNMGRPKARGPAGLVTANK